MVVELIQYDKCTTELKLTTERLSNQIEKIEELEGVRVELEGKVTTYQYTIEPAWAKKEIAYKIEVQVLEQDVRKYKRRWIITGVVGIVVVVGEIVLFSLANK